VAYMAPQVLNKKGYSWHIDWWSLGVTAYEMIFRKRPFDGRNSEGMTQAILKAPLKFPEDALERCSEEGILALKGFIDRDPTTRLGCRPNGQGIDDIRCHPWFTGFDWDGLETKESQPPFVPDMKQANFDVSHELDEFLMVEKPLTHSKRKANPDLEKMKPELRQLEEQFTVYDFSNMKRMSYYPHNQPVVALGTESEDRTIAQSTTGTIIPTATMIDRSQAGSPVLESHQQYIPPIPSSMHGYSVS